jgi:serine-type D-Ala-D-Ala carboxypeptidase/endopeptidase
MIRLIYSTLLLMSIYVSAVQAQPARLSLDDAASLARTALPENLNGQAVAGVLREGKRSFAREAHGVSSEFEAATQLFEIGSITKVFTGLLLAQEVERGTLALDDTLEKLLKGQITFASPKVAAITLKQLVTHTACLPRLPLNLKDAQLKDPYARYTRADLHRAVSRLTLDKLAPCEFSYSNFGMGLLGDLLAQLAYKPYEQLVIERITTPLGMKDTTQQLSDAQRTRLAPAFSGKSPTGLWNFDALTGAGALRTSANDMLTLAQALMAGRKSALGAAAERATQSLSASTPSMPVPAVGYALFLGQGNEGREWSHSGGTGGYRSLIVMQPDKQQAYVLLVSNEEAAPGNLMARLGQHHSTPLNDVAVSEDALASYRGVYVIEAQKSKLTFVAQQGKLYGRLKGQLFNALTPTAKDVFELAEVGARFEFARDDTGQVNAVSLKQRGNTITAKRSDEPAPANTGPTEVQLADYIGRYALAQGIEFDVQAASGALMVKLSNQSRYPVFQSAVADRFEYDAVDAALVFERDANQKITALVLHQNGMKQRAARIKD